MTYRAYDSGRGSFTGVDPAHYSVDLSISPFVYARQSPIGFLDPSGLCSIGGLFNYNSSCYSFADNSTAVQSANLVVCNFTYTIDTSACHKGGLTDTETQVVGAVQQAALAAVTFGGSAELSATADAAGALITSAGRAEDVATYGPEMYRLMQGQLSQQQQLDLLQNLSLELLSQGTDQFLEEYKDIAGPNINWLIATVAKQASFVGLGAEVNGISSSTFLSSKPGTGK
jgi:hypothetical protein